MLIKNLSLKNFKCFEEVDVEFAPITLLTGANSSGKSSLIYSLLAVLQTEQFPFYLSPNGKYVNLGGFEEMVWQGNKEKTLEINLKFINISELLTADDKFQNSDDYPILYSTKWVLNTKNQLPQLQLLESSNDWQLKIWKNDKYEVNLSVESYWVAHQEYLESIIYNYEGDIYYDESYDKRTIILSAKFDSILQITEFFRNIFDYRLHEYFANLKHQDNRFNYIGSFRTPPERTYYNVSKADSKVKVDGSGYIDQIIEWEETNLEKLAELAKIMSELELFQEIKSNKFKGGRFELAVKTQRNSELAALTDVGFGISQFLPIIVADLQLDDQSCLALSQPEIHLHPKIQALFGNFLANQIKHTQKQYIVETHSEYLLNRIRLLLVKGELKPEDVRVYYFENDGIKTTTHKIEFATDGQIKGAPESFFDTYAVDVMDIALNA